ncbi:MAG: 2-hydroxyacid dehydrogenase [Vibrio sp.]
MKPTLVLYKTVSSELLEKLQSQYEVIYFESVNEDNQDEFIKAVQSANVTLGASVKLGRDVLENAPNLKVISTVSTGIDCFDLDYLNERRIALMHTPDVLTETTADGIFASLMCSARRTTELNNLVTSGNWNSGIESEHYGCDVHGKTLGILGMGRIGLAIAKRAHFGFGMNIKYYNRSQNQRAEQEFSAQKLELDDLLQQSDFVVSILPSTAQTQNLFTKPQFQLMKPSAIFINGGRGDVVDEDDLTWALKNKQIRAAGLDVYRKEPLDKNSELMTLPNATLFPHIGSATEETRHAMLICAIDNVAAALNGDYSNNCANRNVMES